MANNFYKFLGLFCILLFVHVTQLYATHIRAGEITARRIDPQRPIYEITVTAYADRDSPVLFGSNGILDFGDGTSEEIRNTGDSGWIPRVAIDENTWRYTLTRVHTFPGQKTYKISFRELYRNEGVLNMDNSVNMPFYIETVIVIDAFLGVNNTPELLVPPVDKAAVGKIYIHNPGAFDIDGDSLSYRLVVCKQDEDVPVANYRFPQNTFPEGDPRNGTSITGGEPTLTLDPLEGDLIWNTPGTKGEYNVAFFIEEWRKIDGDFFFLGYVTRDMQIIVEDTENEPPVLELPRDTCVVAGTILEAEILANDPDGDPVKIESFGGPYTLGATFTPNDGRIQTQLPARVQFRWETNCSHVQDRPYTVQFRATDARGGGVSLTDLQSWNVTVVAPPPTISSVNAVNSRSVDVNFNSEEYFCQEEATQIQVWRRVNSNDFVPDTCQTGMPAGSGYTLVNTRGITDFPFRDTNADRGLNPGATYCYRIVAVFPQPRGGESIVSEEVCVTLPAAVPMITNVSIEETDEENGEVLVRWTPPLEIDEELQPPYTYDLYRGEGFNGGAYELIRQGISDTVITDTGLDTRNGIFNYYVMFKSQGEEVDSSSIASTVRLEPQPLVGAIELSWSADVPWSNQTQENPYHYIYRNNVPGQDQEAFVLIDSVNVFSANGFRYLDDGTATEEEELLDTEVYCYFVTTSGSYGNPLVPSPLYNNSQKICAQPNDTIPPCPPVTFELDDLQPCEEFLANTPCSVQQFDTELVWEAQTNGNCQNDVSYWEVYFSPTGEEGTFEVVGTARGSRFVHENLRSLAGFYYIVAVDRSGNRSEPSELVQRDNCPNYWLPNVFTPNGDDYNETFGAPLATSDPNRCPRFVEAVEFRVYNRWGKEVFTYDSNEGGPGQERTIFINWDGRDNNGNRLTPATYFYIATVTFNVLDPDRRTQELRGTVQIMVGDEAQQTEGAQGSR